MFCQQILAGVLTLAMSTPASVQTDTYIEPTEMAFTEDFMERLPPRIRGQVVRELEEIADRYETEWEVYKRAGAATFRRSQLALLEDLVERIDKELEQEYGVFNRALRGEIVLTLEQILPFWAGLVATSALIYLLLFTRFWKSKTKVFGAAAGVLGVVYFLPQLFLGAGDRMTVSTTLDSELKIASMRIRTLDLVSAARSDLLLEIQAIEAEMDRQK